MFRGLTWLVKLVATGLIVSFLSIWTTGYIVTSYVESILKQFELPVEVPPIAMSGVWGKLWGADPLLVADTASQDSEAGGESVDGQSTGSDAAMEGVDGDSTASESAVDESSDASSSSDEDSSVSEDEGMPNATEAFGNIDEGPITDIGGGGGSEAGSGQGSEDANGTESTENAGSAGSAGSAESTDGTEVAVTEDQVTDTKDRMSDEDKSKLLELLMTELPQETWQQISSYMEDGLTDQELLDVQQLMAQYLDDEQYEEMMAILKKY